MLVDIKKDKPYRDIICSQKEYIKVLKAANEYKLWRIKKGFYHTGLNPHTILETSIYDRHLDLTDWDGDAKTFDDYVPTAGLCDDIEQYSKKYEEFLEKDPRKFVVCFYKIKTKEGLKNQWRWSKSGFYIGNKYPKIHNEIDEADPHSKTVYLFQVLEVK